MAANAQRRARLAELEAENERLKELVGQLETELTEARTPAKKAAPPAKKN